MAVISGDERDKQISKARRTVGAVEEREDRMGDIASLQRENKRLREENTRLKTEVDSWRAKAKERRAKCLALKAVIKAIENNIDESAEGDGVEGEPPKAEEKASREPDFTRATVTWEEHELPKSRFDESVRPQIVVLPLWVNNSRVLRDC